MKDRWRISGKRVELPSVQQKDWSFSLRPGGWILAQTPSGERKRMMLSEVRTQLGAALNGILWQGEVLRDVRPSSGSSAGAEADLTAQFPGKVRKILVVAGSNVNEGDSLILVEAMKMEFTIKAPTRGQVKQVLVKEGQQLTPGDRFFDFEMHVEQES